METFVLNSVGTELGVLVKGVVDANKGYFKMFNRDSAEDAISDAYVRLLQHQEMSNITEYVKKLAQVYSKGTRMEYAFTEFESEEDEDAPTMVDKVLVTESNIDTALLDYSSDKVSARLREMYLMYPEDFLRLSNLFREGFDTQRTSKISNPRLRDEMFSLCADFGHTNVLHELMLILKELESGTRVRVGAPVKLVQFKARDGLDIRAHLDDVSIILSDGRSFGIHPWRFDMAIDPDVVKWDVASGRTIDVMRIDYTPLLNYLYAQVYAEPGVDTRHIKWCGSAYKVITPAGREFLNMDREDFMEIVRQELFEVLIENHLAPIVAVSPDHIYVQPKHTLTCDILRVTLYSGRAIDLPVTCHIRKR